MDKLDNYLTIEEAAKKANVGTGTIREWLRLFMAGMPYYTGFDCIHEKDLDVLINFLENSWHGMEFNRNAFIEQYSTKVMEVC